MRGEAEADSCAESESRGVVLSARGRHGQPECEQPLNWVRPGERSSLVRLIWVRSGAGRAQMGLAQNSVC